jgi:hypothetical protein
MFPEMDKESIHIAAFPQNGKATKIPINCRPNVPIIFMEYFGRHLAASNSGKEAICISISTCGHKR